MRKQFVVLFLLVAFGFAGSFAQTEGGAPLDNIFEKEHMQNRRPVPYPSLREADILWSKRVWRIIDLREKINLPMYYPIQKKEDRMNLVSVLMEGVQYHGLPAYSITNDEFKVEIGYAQVQEAMGAVEEVTMVINPDSGEEEEITSTRDPRIEEVKQIMVKEVWYFDRNYSRMDVRIIGLCPIREFLDEANEPQKRQTFWINYEEARDILARHEVFNSTNDAQRRSFDDIFIKRFFGSYIVQETNMYQDRPIESYAVGIEAMLESERIKNEIFNFEHDLWEF